MMAFFLIVLGVPLVLAGLSFVFLKGITWKEFACIVVAQIVVAGSSAGIVSCSNTADVEVWNGRVATKYSEHVSCEHSYTCNCRQVCSGSGSSRSCSTVCDTCYEHSYDVDWVVKTTNAERIEINRVSRQGLVEPPRWTKTQIGEPTSIPHNYVSYIKAAPGTLFRHQGSKDKYANNIPPYPNEVFDYYRINRFVTYGLSVPDGREWSSAISELNADIGRAKQANVIVVIVKNMTDDYYYALEEAWIGGKKNDVILVISVDDAMKPLWAQVMCWTTSELFKVKLRDDIMNDQVITRDAVIEELKTNVSQYYVRKPMKDFEYLKSSIVPSTLQWSLTLLIGVLLAIGMIIVFQINDVFGDERYQRSYRRDSNEFGAALAGSKSAHRCSTHHNHMLPWHRRIAKAFSNARPWEDM